MTSLPCPGLMDFVEREELEGPGLQGFLDKLLAPVRDRPFKVVVLGCTHYPFLWPAIQPFFPEAQMIDDSQRLAQELQRALHSRNLLNLQAEPGEIQLLSSGGEAAVAAMRRLL